MKLLFSLLSSALFALTVQNVIFTNGVGLSRVMRAANRPKTMGRYALITAIFTLLSATAEILLNPVLQGNTTLITWRPFLLAACSAALYLLAAGEGKKLHTKYYRKIEPVLAPAALNTVVLSIPYYQRILKMGIWETIGFSLGTGAAFYLAVLILSGFLPAFLGDKAPGAFRGLPQIFLFIGIFSMAFLGFSA